MCDVLSRSKGANADADADTHAVTDAYVDSRFTYVCIHSLTSKT